MFKWLPWSQENRIISILCIWLIAILVIVFYKTDGNPSNREDILSISDWCIISLVMSAFILIRQWCLQIQKTVRKITVLKKNHHEILQAFYQTVETLSQSHRQEVFLREAGDAIVVVDAQAQVVYVNHRACQIFGFSINEFLQKHFYEMDKVFGPRIWEFHWRKIQELGSYRFESRLRTKTEKILSMDIMSRHVVFENHEYACFILRDDTEQKLYQEELLQTLLHQQSAALNNFPDIAWIKDSDGRFIMVNQAFSLACGKEVPSVIGKTEEEIWPKELTTITTSLFRQVLETGKNIVLEVNLRQPNGTLLWYEWIKSPIKDEFGMIIGTVGIARNITDQKEVEENLRRSQIELTCRVQERTQELEQINQALKIEMNGHEEAKKALQSANSQLEEMVGERTLALKKVNEKLQQELIERRHLESQLVHAQKMESLGQLAAGVAHEINNPIGFVMSNLGTLVEYIDVFKQVISDYRHKITNLEKPLPQKPISSSKNKSSGPSKGEQLEFILGDIDNLLTETKEGTHRVKEIVQGLKSFARLDEGQEKEINLNECIETTLKIVWNELKYKCHVHKKLGELPSIPCYPGQLNQVFMNLLVNAAQAIENQGAITIETKATKTHIEIRISDTGAGIPAENLSRIFDPFFSTKPVGKGTGLGLAISYGIIQKHHGTITVHSEEGKGTEFTLQIPIASSKIHERGIDLR